jgi:cytochrome P450
MSYDIFAPDFAARRDEILDRLLEDAPVHWHPAGTSPREPGGFWTVARYADVLAVKRDPETFSNFETISFGMTPGTFDYEVGFRRLSNNDGDYHDTIRRLCSRCLRPSRLAELTDDLRRKAAEGLDALEAQLRAGETVDLVHGFGYAFPAFAVGRLVGVPEPVLDEFAASTAAGTPPTTDELEAAFEELVQARAAQPADDLTSALVAAAQENDTYLQLDALRYNLIGFYLAGHLTTTHLQAWSVVELDRNEGVRQGIAAHPGAIPGFVEEVLRIDPPVVATFNTVRAPTEVGGQAMQPGEHVYTVYAAANRDPRQFPDPHRFDPERTPNAHFAFTHGAHYCLGASLARLETKLMLEDLLARDLPIAADMGAATLFQNMFVSLPVHLGG